MNRMLAAAAVLVAFATPAFAESDSAFEIQNLNHDKESGWIFDRLITLKLGATCSTKVADKKTGALAKLASDTRYIARYAKVVSGDDWSHIEGQGANDRDANQKIVDKMIEEFKTKFHVTLAMEGDDCAVGGSALWLNYLSSTLLAAEKYPPKSGTMTITINVVAKTKDVKAVVNTAGTALTVTAPRDVEPVGWSDTIANALKRVSSKN